MKPAPEFLLWFRWNGNEELDMANNFRIYKGTINTLQVVKDYHENGENYQLLRVDASVFKKLPDHSLPYGISSASYVY